MRHSVILVGALGAPMIARAARANPREKSLKLFNTHTDETFSSVFWADGQFLPDALDDINRLLRDHRTNTVAQIDPRLLSLLEMMSAQVGPKNTLHVISGYRSPQTNQLLADRSDGVAKHSLHLEGKAIDIRVPGRDLNSVRKAALGLRGGGVGFYPDSQFVHIDTGRVRSW
ncbi:MAG: DUF882 domain-containing protein [Oxalobacteraceae bacterium]